MITVKTRWDNEIPTIYSNESLVCSDIHVPGESRYWINKLIKYGKNQGVKVLFVAGDFWNLDEISRFDLKDKNLDLGTEMEVGRDLLEELTSSFHVVLVCGNHDKRMSLALGGSLSFSEWMKSFRLDNLTVADSDHAFLISNGVRFRVCHPDLYSKVKGSQVGALSQDLQENVIMGHQHYISVSTNKTGKYLAIDVGCMCDPDRFQYKRAATSKLPAWENGFIHIREGKVRLISDLTF